MYSVIQTKDFQKSLKKIIKNGLKQNIINEIDQLIRMLQDGKQLDAKYRDHKLSGDLREHREFHVRSDLLIVYKIEKSILVLTLVEIGRHSYLF